MSALPKAKRLAEAFRDAGRPVVYIAHVLKPDYPDAVADRNRATHQAELKAMVRVFADVKSTDQVIAMLADAGAA